MGLHINNLLTKEYSQINTCISKSLILKIKNEIKSLLVPLGNKDNKNLSKKYYEVKKSITQDEIQVQIVKNLVVRNFYYPNTNNVDLWRFNKLELSFTSKIRKILRNKHFSPFRILNQNKDFFTKENILSEKSKK